MKRTALALSLLALAFAATAPARAADLADARAFVHHLYSRYPEPLSATFDPVGANAKDVFDPSMIALFAENERLTPKDDVGAIDGDPICDCQDSGGVKVKISSVRLITPSHAAAEVDLNFSGEVRHVRLTLIAVRDQWRVYDVHTMDTPSFRAFLIKANRDASGGR
jgi:hypothetical protein